jgi:hypothetical protein
VAATHPLSQHPVLEHSRINGVELLAQARLPDSTRRGDLNGALFFRTTREMSSRPITLVGGLTRGWPCEIMNLFLI